MHRLSQMAMGAILLTTTASASEFEPAMQAFLESEIVSWAQSEVIIQAIMDQNVQNGDLAEDGIIALDTQWRGEVGTGETPTISAVLNHPASDFLREQVAASGGVITEVFIMDMVGLNVAASDVTSDMWQGDEAKFTATYSVGPDAVHFGDVELDESTQAFQGQISLTIVDPTTGNAIGAMTVGVNAEALF